MHVRSMLWYTGFVKFHERMQSGFVNAIKTFYLNPRYIYCICEDEGTLKTRDVNEMSRNRKKPTMYSFFKYPIRKNPNTKLEQKIIGQASLIANFNSTIQTLNLLTHVNYLIIMLFHILFNISINIYVLFGVF